MNSKILGALLIAYAVIAFILQPWSYRLTQVLGMPISGQILVQFLLNPIVAVLSNLQLGLGTDMTSWLIILFYYVWSGIVALIGVVRLFRND